jgi:anti-sigma regulatory factor (Ser/Thr protein kinase)
MSEVAAYLVVLHKHAHPESVEATIAATRQLKGVAGVRTLYDDAGKEIRDIRAAAEDVRAATLERARRAGGM